VVDLVHEVDDDALDAPSPATPGWRVRDVVAHLSGACADVVSGNLDGVASDPWTAAQVSARRGWEVSRLLDEWNDTGTQVEAAIRAMPDLPSWRTLVADAVTHEHDVRSGLGRPGARDSEAVVYVTDSAVPGIGARLERKRLGVLRVALDDDAPATVGSGDVAASVRIPRFELLRTMTGRRSRSQIAAYEWDGEPQPGWLVFGLFTPRPTSLVE